MKTATIQAVAAGEAWGYAWKWHCSSEHTQSATAFAYYFECLTDARRRGYDVELTRAHGDMAPGGAGYGMTRAA